MLQAHLDNMQACCRTNQYTANARQVDTFVYEHKDYVILFAASNSGPALNSVGSPGTCKNCITVGAGDAPKAAYKCVCVRHYVAVHACMDAMCWCRSGAGPHSS